MLMSHLHATLRTLLPSNRTIEEVVTTASSTFCQSALPAQFATLVLGKADRSGKVELVNADGITESTDEAGNEFDQNRLAETLLQSGDLLPPAVLETIQRTIVRYTNGAQPSDDRTMLALRWSPKGI